MTTSDERALRVLQSLLRVYRDTTDAYASADRLLPDPDIGRELERYQRERIRLMAEVEQHIRDLRSTPAPAYPVSDRNVGDALPDPAVATSDLLSRIERQEVVAVDTLKQGLQEQDIDEPTRHLLERHYEQVQAAHDRIRQLRDRSTAVH